MRIGKRCYVGNLAWGTSWQDLKDKFREVGNVVYSNVMKDESGERGNPYSEAVSRQLRSTVLQMPGSRVTESLAGCRAV
jgi:RNA recognition motif-containing protein